MGHLVNGQWESGNVITSNKEGEFKREESTFRSTIEKGGEFEPEKDRYHLYVSYACPWAHRTLMTRAFKNLEDYISVSVVSPDMLEHSWSFETKYPDTTGDQINNKNYLYEVYQLHDPKVSCKVTVPVLWDKKTRKIVNNESSEIVRIFNTAFDELTDSHLDLYPENLRADIDKINERVYRDINNGVYKTGFARSQKAYEDNYDKLFSALNYIEGHLVGKDYLLGERITEADIRLVATLLRFDAVYFSHLKCNKKRISDYKHLSEYLKRMFHIRQVRETTYFNHIKRHYYYSHEFLNPSRIVPLGPEVLVE